MSESINEQIQALALRYSDCGIDESIIREMMDDHGKPSGLDGRAKLIGIRMALGMEFSRQELFSVDDLCHVTGETPESAMKMMQEAGVSPIQITPAPWLKGGAL